MSGSHLFDPKNIATLERKDRKLWQNPDEILGKGDLKPDYIAADVGCGSGFFTVPLAQIVKKVFAIDAQQEMLDYLEIKIEKLQINNIELLLARKNELPLANDTIDLLISINTLHEFKKKDYMINEMRRVLKPDGQALICDFEKRDTGFGPPVSIRLARNEATTLFESIGFKILQIHPLKYHYLFVLSK